MNKEKDREVLDSHPAFTAEVGLISKADSRLDAHLAKMKKEKV